MRARLPWHCQAAQRSQDVQEAKGTQLLRLVGESLRRVGRARHALGIGSGPRHADDPFANGVRKQNRVT
jgi:hypothetical protein